MRLNNSPNNAKEIMITAIILVTFVIVIVIFKLLNS